MTPLWEMRRRLARRHHFIGWWGLLLFLSLGIALETMHGFKSDFYLDPAHRFAGCSGHLLTLTARFWP